MVLDETSYSLTIHPGHGISKFLDARSFHSTKHSTVQEVVKEVRDELGLSADISYVLVEMHIQKGEETVLANSDYPFQRMMLWPRNSQDEYQFVLRQLDDHGSVVYSETNNWHVEVDKDSEKRQLVEKGFLPENHLVNADVSDLCHISNLNQRKLLSVLTERFMKDKTYTYSGDILISFNPYKFLPIYNPKYMSVYRNRKKEDLDPHIYAVADAAFSTMIKNKQNQCVVITGKSGSGKTQATHFLVHHSLHLCQKSYMNGVERMLVGCGPVLEVILCYFSK